MVTAAIVDLKIFTILTVSVVKMTIGTTLPRLAVIGQTISGIWPSCDFSKWQRPLSCIFKFSKF